MKLSAWASENQIDVKKAAGLLRDLRKADKEPGGDTPLTPVEVSKLADLLKGDQTPIVEKESAEASNIELRDQLRELRAQLAMLNAGRPTSEQQQEINAAIANMQIAGFRPMADSARGQAIEVNIGDRIVHDLSLRNGRIKGGWRKASSDETTTTRVRNVMALSRVRFIYDSACGAPYHSVKFKVIRRWYDDRGGDVEVAVATLNDDAQKVLS